MKHHLSGYRRYVYLGMILVALGITLSTALKDSMGAIGVVLIAIGGLLFILGMRMKKGQDTSGKS
jgi:Sec-independent protein secretion pathway component TatC